MYYYEVWVRSHRYQNREPLTYSSTSAQTIGSVVWVPLQQSQVLAIVVKKVPKPFFTCKPIAESQVDFPPLPIEILQLFRWLQSYYPSAIGPLTQLFLPDKLVSPAPLSVTQASKHPIELNAEQQTAFQQIAAAGTYLLHGRTGSGKTRLYAALAQSELAQGRSVLILSPEISLTPQLVHNFKELLGQPVVVLHSKLTAKQRRENWSNLLTATTPQIVIGPRSALFAPLGHIGLIVIDEVHEPAYKQEQQPYYYAPRVAAKLAELHQAKLVLGSATPPVSEYYLAAAKQRPIVRLNTLAIGQQTHVTQQIVDLSDRSQLRQSPYLSDALITALRSALESGEQSMLYLNRRGTARLSLCQHCGWQARCAYCDISMTYHGDSHQLTCHTCGRHQRLPTTCPDCGQTDIIFKSAGTKAIVDEVTRLFPEARVKRFDTDNSKADRFEQHYESVQRGDIDILVGTQLLAKGLDLPKLTTLGIILADSSLSIPDFTAGERTYQLIQQVLGRIARGHQPHAIAIIQTYNPESPILHAALQGDWSTFYEREITERQQFVFPPFCHLLKLVCRRKSAASAEKAANQLAGKLADMFDSGIEVNGPTPAFHEKVGGYFYWQLVIKSRRRATLVKIADELPKNGWLHDIDPINLL